MGSKVALVAVEVVGWAALVASLASACVVFYQQNSCEIDVWAVALPIMVVMSCGTFACAALGCMSATFGRHVVGGLLSVATAAAAFSGAAVECMSLDPIHLAAIGGVAAITTVLFFVVGCKTFKAAD